MKHIKTVLLIAIMIGLDLDQHQRSMDVLLHCQQLVRDVLWCNMSIVLYMRGMYMSLLLFDQSLEGKVKRSLWEEKGVREDTLWWWCSTTIFPRYFSFLLFLLLLLLLVSFLRCLRTRSSNPSNNYLALGRVPH